jgi:hypothetical protein
VPLFSSFLNLSLSMMHELVLKQCDRRLETVSVDVTLLVGLVSVSKCGQSGEMGLKGSDLD